MSKLAKPSVHYRTASGSHKCGTCDMYSSGTCSLVSGSIDPQHVCDRWEAKAVSATPYMDRVLRLAFEHFPDLDPDFGKAKRGYQGPAGDRSRAEHAVWPHAHMPAEFHSDTPGHSAIQAMDRLPRVTPEHEALTRSRDYTREEHGKLEHVTGHALRAHMLARHPSVYPYLMEGRDMGQLHELHMTDHERHTHHPLGHDSSDLSALHHEEPGIKDQPLRDTSYMEPSPFPRSGT